MPIISRIVKGIGSGIGLASEAIADHKERNSVKDGGLSQTPSTSSETPRSTSAYAPEKSSQSKENDDSSSEDDLDNDQAEWALDEAARELDPPAYSEQFDEVPPIQVDDLVQSFNQRHHTGLSVQVKPIPMPVILPQRRPKDKSRGFVRAYPPILGEYSDIDQQTFIDFLDDFDKSSKASPVFDVINLACFAAGLVPNPIAMAVTTAVQVASRTAQEMQGLYRTNSYLDQINESLFKPRGLYAMIMAFKPDSPNDPVIGMNLTSTDVALTKSLSVPESDFSKKMKKFRFTSGAAQGELALPESAPLVYPALDAAAEAALNGNGQLSQQKQNSLKESSAFIATYFDRRAQATYTQMHPDSKITAALPPPEKKFASRFSDPNHPANSGTILGLLTGGNFDPKAKKRGRRAQQRARREGRELSENDTRNAEMGRRLKPKKGLITRFLQKNLLYLIITNLPSEAEMKEMLQELERMKNLNQ